MPDAPQQDANNSPVQPQPVSKQLWSSLKIKAVEYIATTIIAAVVAVTVASAAATWAIIKSWVVFDMPQGAVVAFSVESGCPAKWEQYKPATARVIIGAGANFPTDSSSSKDDRGEPLSPKGFLEYRGEQKHLLTKAELPKERVFFAVFKSSEFSLVNSGYPGDRFVGANPKGGPPLGTGAAGTFDTRVTEPMGEGTPHSVMPPYVALYYCRKT
jgi:hypothetical protein